MSNVGAVDLLCREAEADEAKWYGGWDVSAARPFWARPIDTPYIDERGGERGGGESLAWCTMAGSNPSGIYSYERGAVCGRVRSADAGCSAINY